MKLFMHTLTCQSGLFSWKPSAPSCDSPAPTSPGAPFPLSLPDCSPLPLLGQSRVCPGILHVCCYEPTLPKVPRGAVESTNCGCSSQELPSAGTIPWCLTPRESPAVPPVQHQLPVPSRSSPALPWLLCV